MTLSAKRYFTPSLAVIKESARMGAYKNYCRRTLSAKEYIMATNTDSATVMVRDFRCNGCGAPLPIPKNSKGHVRCPSCKTECVIEGLVKNAEIAAKENIESGIHLFASPATLHRQLVSSLGGSPSIPLDVFNKAEVIREERYCVPAYCFHCNGTESFNYEVGNTRSQTYTVDRGDSVDIHEKTRMEWSPSSGTASVRQTIFASGNRKMASQIAKLYTNFDPKKLIDVEELDFPADVETLNSDLPQTAAFNEYAVPRIEKALKKKAEEAIAKQTTTGLTLGGANIQKEAVRVFLGLYRVVYKYGGKEYSMWATGNGEKTLCDEPPTDSQRQQVLAEKQQAKDSIPLPKTRGLTIGFWLGIIAAPFTVISIILTIICGVKRSKKRKGHAAKQAEIQKEIDAFQYEVVDAVQRFKSQKKALRGIYADVTGDASAF
jgi:uncharacterized Zn finger protein (UPF0148 family)